MAKMTVYHGGYIPVKNPEIRIGRNTKDFGNGFYCTIIKEQAQRWAKRYETKIVSIWTEVLHENSFGFWQSLNTQRIKLIFVQKKH